LLRPLGCTKLAYRRARNLGKFFALWLLGGVAITIPLSQINLVRFLRLKRQGIRTNGLVTDLEPTNHQAVHYSFKVAGRTYSGIGRAGFGNPEFCLTRGQDLIVYYLPSDHFESCAGNPKELISNEVPPIVLAGITFPLFALGIYSWRFPPFRRWLFVPRSASHT